MADLFIGVYLETIITYFIFYRLATLTMTSHQYTDADASTQSQTDVLLRSLPELRHLESLLPGCEV